MPKTPSIAPLRPRPFPPRKLKKKAFAPLLQKANLATAHCAAALKTTPSHLLTPLLTQEGSASLESHKNPASFTHQEKVQIQDYLAALSWASQAINRSTFSKKQTCHIHRIMKRATSPKEDLGRYRKRQNWIGPNDCSIEEAYFYPPKHTHVPRMMQQLFCYMKKKEEEPLLQLALAFAQLLIIHPFMDGNGRIARIWIPLFLYKKKILPSPSLFLSHYFKQHRLKYFQTLFQTSDENKWENWIAFFLKGIILESKRVTKRLRSV